MTRITALTTHDIRFPTSQFLDGSDAMNPDPDYSAAYVVVETDADDGISGHGFVFTIGRGNDVVLAAIRDLQVHLVGRDLDALLAHMGQASSLLIDDSQLRWLGPEKGVEHMAAGAVLTALWDIKAKRAGLPLWRLLAEMTPEEIVECVDFRYLTDALTPEDALAILRDGEDGKAERIDRLLATGYPAYTTTPGWLGYSDEKMIRLAHEAIDRDGFAQIKLKVGADLKEDRRRLALARKELGPHARIAVDANQVWDVGQAIDWIHNLAEFDLAWVEEPTSPDDALGHATIRKAVSPTPIASGEHMMNRILAKQFLQAEALDIVQIDATRVAGPQENIAILLLAKKFGVPVCPHAGGVGLCELVQHMSMFDYVAISGTTAGRRLEYVDHLHEHFVTPVLIRDGHYVTPTSPGTGAEMLPESISTHDVAATHDAATG